MAGPEDQFEIMQAMNTLLVNFKKDGPGRKTPEMVWRKIKELDEYWTEFESNHANLKNWVDHSHTYFTHKKYEETMDFYHKTKNFLTSHLPQEQSVPTPIVRPAKSKVERGGPSSQGLRTPTDPNTQQPNFQPRVDTNSTTSSKIEELLYKQSSNYRAFSRTANNININEIQQKWELDETLKSLQERWTAIDKLYWEIDGTPGAKDFSDDTQYSLCEQQYKDMTRLISNKLGSLAYKEKSTPTLDLPTFSGGYQNWTSFKDLFTEVVHNNASISDVQKMQHLKGKVKGEAEKLIQHLMISPNNYHTCWEILNARYNNKKLIFSSHLNTLLSLPTIQQPSAAAIKKIHDTTKECLYAITNLGVDTSSWDPIIVHLISQKLDADTHNDYLEHLAAPRELPNLREFLEFLEIKFTSLEASRRRQDGIKSVSSQQQESSSNSKKIQTYKAYSTNKKGYNNQSFVKANNQETTICQICEGNHRLFTCKSFLELQPAARLREVTKHNLCKNCLFDHNENGKNGRCYSEKTCRVCNEYHNTLLHDAYSNNAINKLQNSNNEIKKSTGNSHVSQDDLSETLLSTALIRVQGADKTLITLRALIDQGSQISLITEHAAQMLKLPRERCKGVVFGIGAKESTCKGVMNITCLARHNDYTLNTNVYVMKNLINQLPNNSFQKPQWSFLENIQLADPDFHISRSVDLLLGADIYSTIIQTGIIKHEKSSLVAQQTRFGWILCGHVQTFHCNVVLNNVDDIQRFWSVEDISESTNMSQEDLECLQHYKDTTIRKEDGRYVVKYPFTDDMEEKLGASKPKAAAQFRNLERKLSKQPNLAHAYQTYIEEYHSLNHMAECTSNVTPSCYLPHHGVERADSATTALRVVFNASAKTSTGYTLNDLMNRGPNLQQDLMSLILRWRQYQYAFTADIEKMFRQILISDDHQRFQKILWRSSPNQLLREYQLTTVTYGMKAAPFLALMTLKQLAMDDGHKHQKSRAAIALQEEFYMDDLVSGSFTLSSAKQLQEDLIKLLQSGGFNLRKWTSNKTELLEGFSKAQSSHEAFSFKQSESTKTLGLQWHPEKDIFTFHLKIDIATNKHTKRSLLSDRFNFVYMILSFMFFMTLVTIAHSAYNVTKLSKALYFDKISTMQYIQDEWKLIAYYDINPYWEGTATFTKHLKQISATCEKLEQEKLCDVMLLQLRHSYDELNHYNTMLLDSNTHVRRKRGLVNGIGSIANTLFGVLDENFAIQYQKDITLIRENQNHLALLWKNQTSVIEAEHNLLQRAEDTINKQHKIINQHLNNLSRATNQLNKEMLDLKVISELAISFSIANNIIAKLRYIQDTLLDTITELHHGIFNIHLLTPKQLQHELNVISGHLQKDLALPINNIQTDLAKIYHLLKVRAGITKQFIIFEIKIPLVNRENYELYKIIAIPQEVANYTANVTPVSEYVAINLRRNTYIPLSEIDIQHCIQYDTYIRLCHSPRPVYQFLSDESLCFKDQITNKCHSTITPCRNKWHELNIVNTYLFYCCGHCTWRIICDDRISAVQVEGAGFIALGQNCVIKGQDFAIFAHRNQHSTVNVIGDLYIPDVPPINHIINISVPVPDIIPPSDSNQTAEQLRDLKQRIEEMKSDTALAGSISYHDVHQYTVIYVVMAGCLTMAAVYVCRRARRRRRGPPNGEHLREDPQPPATAAPRRAPRPRQRPPQPPQPQQASNEFELREFAFHPV